MWKKKKDLSNLDSALFPWLMFLRSVWVHTDAALWTLFRTAINNSLLECSFSKRARPNEIGHKHAITLLLPPNCSSQHFLQLHRYSLWSTLDNHMHYLTLTIKPKFIEYYVQPFLKRRLNLFLQFHSIDRLLHLRRQFPNYLHATFQLSPHNAPAQIMIEIWQTN